jgi:enamine deaminase RidA (YjgF/YER057c/UK114 family)
MGAEEAVKSLGLSLPDAPSPAGAYVPYVLTDSLLFISGQIPLRDGKMIHEGKVGREVDLDSARECAHQCFLNALAQAKAALGSLDRVVRVVRLSGYVASAEGFTDQVSVMNEASELAVSVFGEAGRHSRIAIGAAELPLGAPIEIDVILEVTES